MGNLPIANKELGQHFLKDKGVIQKITTDYLDDCDVIVEIGPGPAILTQHLVGHKKDIYVIEKDKRFVEQLQNIMPIEKIYFEDAVKFNWENFITDNSLKDKKIWLVSNLPYNVSSVLFIQFLQITQIKFLTLMFQKEVGEKTYLRPHTKNQMSSLLCLSNNFFESNQLAIVKPGAFNPPPKVDSVVVSYKRINSPKIPIKQFKVFETFLRSLFQFKRKQLGSVLKSVIEGDRIKFLSDLGIDSTCRAETLTFDQIYSIFNKIQDS